MKLRISVSRLGGIRFQVSVGKAAPTKNYMDVDEGRKSAVGGQEAEIEVCHGPKGVSIGLYEKRESQAG